jgi:uncharacterized membrane protein YeaQ/YmgE (transglycosylase-associated protein family)
MWKKHSSISVLSILVMRSARLQKGDTMSFFAWIVLGLIAGFIGSKIVNRRGEGILLDILLGVVGAFAGGWLFSIFGAPGVSGLNIYSLFVAVIGSVVLLVLHPGVFLVPPATRKLDRLAGLEKTPGSDPGLGSRHSAYALAPGPALSRATIPSALRTGNPLVRL